MGLLRIFKKYYQRAKKGYSYEDLWSINNYFQTTFANMIDDFEKEKIGSPICEFKEVDLFDKEFINKVSEEIYQEIAKSKYFNDINTIDEAKEYFKNDNYIKWRIVLKRIAYCLRESSEDFCSQENEYWHRYYELNYEKDKLNEDEQKENKKLEKQWLSREKQIDKYRTKMKDEAFKLISKYFFNLWD